MGRMFGTDGVRGIANKELTPELATKIAIASSCVLEKRLGRKPKILIGKDTRISGTMLEAAMVAGYTSVGASVDLLGVIPTPAVAYLVRRYSADAGVVISASHNPYEFNGIKIFGSDGTKIPDNIEDEIEEEILFQLKNSSPEINEKIGKVEYLKKGKQDYIDFLLSTTDLMPNDLKIGVDCANGATSEYAPAVLKKLGLDFKVIGNKPDGININDNCGSTHLEQLQKLVVENNLDVGLAFDGDGDRFLAVDHEGNVIDGDQIIAICAIPQKEHNLLDKDNTIVVTVMSNIGIDKFAKENGFNVVKTKVGDKYVLREMVEHGYCFGGEQSGHIIFKRYNTTGDGIITALQVLRRMTHNKKSLKELCEVIHMYPQVLVNAKVLNNRKMEYIEDEEISEKILEIENEFKDNGRVLIRPSGTEPLIRVMIEGEDQEYITKKANELAKMIEDKFGK